MPLNINQQYIAPAVAMTLPANPTAPASTSATYKMQGLGALITPQLAPGIVLANISATVNWVSSGAVGVGIALQLYFGPMVNGVAAPANAAAVPGGTTLFHRNASARSTINASPTTEVSPSKI